MALHSSAVRCGATTIMDFTGASFTCSCLHADAYPCAVTSKATLDYKSGDLEQQPRFGQTVDSCTDTCVKTAECFGLVLKSDGRCYLKGSSFGSIPSDWEKDPYTSVSVNTKACEKPADLLPLRNPIVVESPPVFPSPSPSPEPSPSPSTPSPPDSSGPPSGINGNSPSPTPQAPESGKSKSKVPWVGILVGVLAGVLVTGLCACCIVYFIIIPRRNRRSTDARSESFKPLPEYGDMSVGTQDSAFRGPASSQGAVGGLVASKARDMNSIEPSSASQGTCDNGVSAGPAARAADVGLPEVRGIGLYQNAIDNAQLDNTSDVQHKADSRRMDVLEALGYMIEYEDGCVDRKYLLDDAQQNIVGGQAVITMVSSIYSSNRTFAMKLFADRQAYLREREVYLQYSRVLGMTDDFYYDDRDHEGELMPNNLPRPSYIVLQKGLSMQKWILARANNKGKIGNPYEIMWMLSELCNQLMILHDMGYVHRDVKPENVLWLKEQNTWRLIDFGSTVKHESVAPVECTIRFAAPEAVEAYMRKEPLLTQPSLDVYSVGVMAFELITGQRLFPQGSTANDMKAILMGEQPFPHEQNPLLLRPAGKLRKTVQSMLSRNPADRPTIHQVVAKFQTLADDTGCTLTSLTPTTTQSAA